MGGLAMWLCAKLLTTGYKTVRLPLWLWAEVLVFSAMRINHLIGLSGCRLWEAEVKRLTCAYRYHRAACWRGEGGPVGERGSCDLWQSCVRYQLHSSWKETTRREWAFSLASSHSSHLSPAFLTCSAFLLLPPLSSCFVLSPSLGLTLSFLLLPLLSLQSLSPQSVLLDQA